MKHIAIVDDDNVLLHILQDLFEVIGLQVSAFNDPVVALKSIKELKPDAVLSDVLMPNLTGFELCRELRSDKSFAKTPIFLMSAKHSIGELSKSMMAGADEYIIKPFQMDDIFEQLKQFYKKKNNPIIIKPLDS
ncbi:response regulator [Paenibacillus alginolyticus]|uniref:Response regulator n=1 Tax=Paenibacillus alginolyticus TaxID=59839 RepID=A0ABT4GEE4_9BACL|nr:response regulator [Paenibacillus alginolyticus]MCY9666615.1 response regulator [Paenibacillus alginolyticus]MCY9694562.1 response regulator [Paenibacillus alginolyticus]MEC0148129.1 response regulator [Paenibacillus alginolyticus]